jgi:hypothetical protein
MISLKIYFFDTLQFYCKTNHKHLKFNTLKTRSSIAVMNLSKIHYTFASTFSS